MTQNNFDFGDVLKKLNSVITALNGVDVKGKTNLMNLGGSIAILEEVANTLQTCTMNKREVSEDTSSV